MTDRTYKNHPTVMIQNTILVVFVFAMMSLSLMKPGAHVDMMLIYGAIAVFIILELFIVYAWKKTTITFEPDQIVVDSNVIYKRRKTIPYSKIASANVVRTVFNRILGTTTLQININSATNAARPEASFVFKADLAEKLRGELMSGLFKQTYDPKKEKEYESVLKFNGWDSVLYGMIGKSSFSFLSSVFWGAYSVISLLFFNTGSFIFALMMLIFSGIMPIISLILRYCNFRVYRVDNTMRIEHGLIQTYRTSFEITRINAVRVRRPLFARLMHKCCIETEVVGINAMSDDVTPLISLLINEDQLEYAMQELLPEFIRDIPVHKQPAKAKLPTYMRTTYVAVAWLALLGSLTAWLFLFMEPIEGSITASQIEIFGYLTAVITVLGIVFLYWGAFTAMNRFEFGMGGDMFTIVNGIVDRSTTTVQYDRVQISSLYATPMPRRFGLARANISMLSSAGARTVKSGFFEKEELEKISATMLSRLADGEYDYRMTEI